jgi:hypothetical protein
MPSANQTLADLCRPIRIHRGNHNKNLLLKNRNQVRPETSVAGGYLLSNRSPNRVNQATGSE